MLVALVLFGCVGCDQLSKAAAREYLAGSAVHSYLGDTFRLQFAQNPGAFLSLGESLPPAIRYGGLTIAVGIFVTALLAWALLSSRLRWRGDGFSESWRGFAADRHLQCRRCHFAGWHDRPGDWLESPA
jgi:signal peptidase II